jgi:hypothetical protein
MPQINVGGIVWFVFIDRSIIVSLKRRTNYQMTLFHYTVEKSIVQPGAAVDRQN